MISFLLIENENVACSAPNDQINQEQWYHLQNHVHLTLKKKYIFSNQNAEQQEVNLEELVIAVLAYYQGTQKSKSLLSYLSYLAYNQFGSLIFPRSSIKSVRSEMWWQQRWRQCNCQEWCHYCSIGIQNVFLYFNIVFRSLFTIFRRNLIVNVLLICYIAFV